MGTPTTQARKTASKPIKHDVLEDDESLYETRTPSSVRRYRPETSEEATVEEPTTKPEGIIQRRSSRGLKHPTSPTTTTSTNPGVAPRVVAPSLSHNLRQNVRQFPLVAILITLVAAMVLFMALMAFGSWWQVYQDDLHYGRPRTAHLDAVVGHNDSEQRPTHFIFLNLKRHVQIIEIPGGDVAHSRLFVGPVLFGDGQDLTPVTGEVRDVNGDGRPDLIVSIMSQRIIYLNDGKTFIPQ